MSNIPHIPLGIYKCARTSVFPLLLGLDKLLCNHLQQVVYLDDIGGDGRSTP